MAKSSDKGWMPGAERKPDADGTSKCYKPAQNQPFELLAVVEHIAEGTDSTWKWLFNEQVDGGGPVSSHFFVLETGEVMQGVNIYHRAWTNGLKWDGRYYYDPQGAKVEPTWWRIAEGGTHRGQDPNKLTVTIEHSGYYNKPRTTPQMKASQSILRWVQQETGLVYIAEDTLIGHYHISPKNRANCPGPYFDLTAMAAGGNLDPLKVRKVPGVGGDKYCGEGFYQMWLQLGGVNYTGLAMEDEVESTDEQGEKCTKQGYERMVFKFKKGAKPLEVHVALRSEAAKLKW